MGNKSDNQDSQDSKELAKQKRRPRGEQSLAQTAIVPSIPRIPSKLGLVVVNHRPLFPHMIVPLVAEGAMLSKAIVSSLQNKKKPPYIAVVLAKDDFDIKNFDIEHIFEIGVVARIVRTFHLSGDVSQVLIDVISRAKIIDAVVDKGQLQAKIEVLKAEEIVLDDSIRAYSREIVSNLKELVRLNPLVKEEMSNFFTQINIDDPSRLADFSASLTSAKKFELQNILEQLKIYPRLEQTLLLIKKELDLSRLQAKISHQIEEKISKTQREFFLKEQLKEIRKELGLTKDEKSQDLEKFKARAKKLSWPSTVKKVFEEELQKLSMLEPLSAEFNVSRTYLDWLTILPWGVYQKENLNLIKAKQVLEEDHFGLSDVKERVLDLIAAMSLRKTVSGKILCLVGPPGVGKTSIGKSIARALGRPFYRFSLGGMRDEAEIKGHRRTYIGAMPGKFLQALKVVGKANCVIMLDEIDKVGRSFTGDPSSALLEVLDREQNHQFIDHYLDVPFDLSKILFIATANQTDSIPEPLLDRMDLIRLSGYVLEEKMQIAKRFLAPRGQAENGLAKRDIVISDAAIGQIIESYTREAGVRNLDKMLEKIFRGIARDVVSKKIKPKAKISISKREVVKYLKHPRFTTDKLIGENQAGCVNALAWTSYGGAILSIEAIALKASKEAIKQTGQLGKVMVESSEIAHSYVLSSAKKFRMKANLLKDHLIHLHVPAGAVPKDGPSAGMAMAMAMVSLLSDKAVKPKIGMTGELSLTGEVLPIGGLKEKIVAAQQNGIKEVIIPTPNKPNFMEIPKQLRKNIKCHFVSYFNEAVPICLPNLEEK